MGAVIGMERQSRGKVAGLRTTMLICTGAALFMIVSQLTADKSGDTGRIAAQVVTGIGFIGAGTILHHRLGVTGLTTAATIFVVAAIGLAVGGGHMTAALVGTTTVLVTLILVGNIEFRLNSRRQTYHYSFNTAAVSELMNEINSIAGAHKLELEDVEMSRKDENNFNISFSITTTPEISREALTKLLATGSVFRVTAPSGSQIEKEK